MNNQKVRFDRNEFAGAFGDIGTDLPLIVGMLLVSDLNVASVLIIYGLLQIFSGFYYGIPMAVQPLKAVASIVIAQKVSGDLIIGAGLSIGIIMLFFSWSGLLRKLGEIIPVSVIKGIQIGLGLMLAIIALKDYLFRESGYAEIILVIITFAIGIIFIGNRKIPASLIIILVGVIFAFLFRIDEPTNLFTQIGLELPGFNLPDSKSIIDGFFLLAIPQIPLSLGNSILASNQLAKDLFPEKKISISKIGWTYSLMNIFSSFFGGIPVCHGSGGLMGHYTFGGRTGGSVVIYGLMFLILGLFFSQNFMEIVKLFPPQVLGVILLFESVSLILVIKGLTKNIEDVLLAGLVAMFCVFLPYGFFIGVLAGTIFYYFRKRLKFQDHE